MNHDFDSFVKDHLNEILCQVEKEQALKLLRKKTIAHHTEAAHSVLQQLVKPEVYLQDCAISPSFSHSHL